MGIVLKFFTGMICKYFTTVAIEKIIIALIKEGVKRTDSKLDDEIFEAVFGKLDKTGHENSDK